MAIHAKEPCGPAPAEDSREWESLCDSGREGIRLACQNQNPKSNMDESYYCNVLKSVAGLGKHYRTDCELINSCIKETSNCTRFEVGFS